MLRFRTLFALGLLTTGCSAAAADSTRDDSVDLSAASLDARFFDANVADDDTFTHANPDPTKVDPQVIEKMLDDAQASGSESAIIALGDTIIAEKYFGHDGRLTSVQSVTKSITSLLIGILVDQGKIASLDAPMSTWLPEWANDPLKSRVTLRHMLTMTSGMTDQPYVTEFTRPYLETLAARPLSWEPGRWFAYTTYGAYLLTAVIREASGQLVDDFARTALFEPLGIRQFFWMKDGQNNADTGGGLYLRPRDMLRIGKLVRDGGEWKGQRIVSDAWITTSMETAIPQLACYAMEWWVLREGCDSNTGAAPVVGPEQGFYADGYGGQYITVVPSSKLLGVRTTTPPASGSVEEITRTSFFAFPHEVADISR